MSPASKDARCRHDLIFYMDEAASKFTPRSYSIVARKKEFKTFFKCLVNEQPDVMRPFLQKMLRDIPSSTKPLENVVGGKRSAEDSEQQHEAKKAKLERTKVFIKRTFGGEHNGKSSLFIAQDEVEQPGSDNDACESKATYTPYEIEFGLTHGTSQIHSMFATKFATIPHNDSKDGSRIFEMCEQLKFEQVMASLVKFFRTPTRTTGIPLSCDIQDPSEVLKILRKIDRFAQEPKTHKAFGQMKLFTTIDTMAKRQKYSDYQQVINELAWNDVNSKAINQFTEKVSEYRADYHRGRKWLDISESFGGTGIVFIIIVIGFGSWTIGQDLTEFERSCLGIVASHLLGVRKIIECLGYSALEDYCRHGSLGEQKIKDLEELKGLAPDGDEDNSDQESEKDNGDQESEKDDSDQESEKDNGDQESEKDNSDQEPESDEE